PQRPITLSAYGPRYSTGYWALRNRPALLVETHVLKPYPDRLRATYSINLRTLEWVGANGPELLSSNREADRATTGMGPGSILPIAARASEEERPFTFKGLKFDPYRSEISGSEIPRWTREKVDHQTSIRDQFVAAQSVELPA